MLFATSRILARGKNLLWLQYFSEKRLNGFTTTVTGLINHLQFNSQYFRGKNLIKQQVWLWIGRQIHWNAAIVFKYCKTNDT
jgi:hypothetical protein